MEMLIVRGWRLRSVALICIASILLTLARMPVPAVAGTGSAATGPDRPHTGQQLALRITPSAPRPGDVVVAHVTADTDAQITGRFSERSIRFTSEGTTEGTTAGIPGISSRVIVTKFVALIGLDAVFAPGAYSLTITATSQSGETKQVIKVVNVLPRRRFTEYITLSKTLSPTLDPIANADEAHTFQVIYSGFTEPKYWSAALRLPVSGRFSALYGNPRIYNGIDLGTFHSGYDIVAAKGTPVKAAAPGRVVVIGSFVVRGLTIVIDHGYGVFTAYCHLSQTNVLQGQMVQTGQVIGIVGTTGRSQGPHLHFEVAVGGVPVDPGPWLRTPLP
jgi:murein DD-endopeptidase MepM/ murein hydrolase activator NlpD